MPRVHNSDTINRIIARELRSGNRLKPCDVALRKPAMNDLELRDKASISIEDAFGMADAEGWRLAKELGHAYGSAAHLKLQHKKRGMVYDAILRTMEICKSTK